MRQDVVIERQGRTNGIFIALLKANKDVEHFKLSNENKPGVLQRFFVSNYALHCRPFYDQGVIVEEESFQSFPGITGWRSCTCPP